MKKLLLLAGAVAVIASPTGRAQSWTACGVTAVVNNESMGGFAVHNGALYASNYSNRLMKSADGGQSWGQLPLDGVDGQITHIVSAGERLYIATFVATYANGAVFYTTDDGQHWTVDTTDVPNHVFGTGKAFVRNMHYWDGHLMATFDMTDAYLIKPAGDGPWVQNSHLAQRDPADYDSNGDTLFVVSDKLYYTTDHGATWTEPANSGLPNWFAATRLRVAGDRLYLVGKVVTGAFKDSLYYSDDRGENWQNTKLSEYIGTPAIGVYQTVTALYGSGNRVWVALTNDEKNTTPEILYSGDGGTTFTRNIDGLPEDPFGTIAVQKFVRDNGTLYALLNFRDVYKQSIETGTTVQETAAGEDVRLYPHPVADRLGIHGADEGTFSHIAVYDLCGRPVLRREYSGTLDVSALPAGIWLLELSGRHGTVRKTFVRQ